jgi:hypothetical protein
MLELSRKGSLSALALRRSLGARVVEGVLRVRPVLLADPLLDARGEGAASRAGDVDARDAPGVGAEGAGPRCVGAEDAGVARLADVVARLAGLAVAAACVARFAGFVAAEACVARLGAGAAGSAGSLDLRPRRPRGR